jgi:anti-anti-sigma regulatory factor
LIAAHSNFAKRGGQIILCNLDKSLENIFIITKLITVFTVAEDLQTAIKMLS